MSSQYVRIAVGIIAYKQEDVISRMLDSLLKQKDYGLIKILVFDDCSPDRTVDVVKEYIEKYPQIIVLHENLHNLGIYGNAAVMYDALKRIDADILIHCAGDDEYCDGFLAAIQKSVVDNHVDCQKDSVAFYGDWKQIQPNGKSIIFKQEIIKSGEKAIDLHIKGELTNRSSAITKACIKRIGGFPVDKGVAIAEVFCDLQQNIAADKNFYLPVVGSVYYSGIGFSTKMNTPEHINKRIEARKLTLKTFDLERTTRYYLKFQIYLLSYKIDPTVKSYFKALYNYILSKPRLSFRDFIFQLKQWIALALIK